MNNQPSEGLVHRPDGSLEVVHVWSTIQGEGPLAGTPAVFVRLAGCNLECPWCDTDYTSRRKLMLPEELFEWVCKTRTVGPLYLEKDRPLVVLTGGEPLRQNIYQFCSHAIEYDCHVQIETNGTLGMPLKLRGMEHFTSVCSPKAPKIHPELRVDAFKYVLQDGCVAEDGLPMRTLGNKWEVARPSKNMSKRQIYVQPLDEQDEERNRLNTEACVDSCMRHGYRLCLQTHKIVGLE